MTDIQWLYYFWTLTEKYTQDFTSKDNKKGVNYNIKFEFMWGMQTMRVTEETFKILEENKSYALPVWTSTNKNIDFTSLFVKSKKWVIYEIQENGDFVAIN